MVPDIDLQKLHVIPCTSGVPREFELIPMDVEEREHDLSICHGSNIRPLE
jgi:hypothetical protein